MLHVDLLSEAMGGQRRLHPVSGLVHAASQVDPSHCHASPPGGLPVSPHFITPQNEEERLLLLSIRQCMRLRGRQQKSELFYD